MQSGRQNQLTKQTGEYLACAELCRRGYIATSFTGSVPDYDVIAIDKNNKAIQIQVKTIRSGTWQLNARNYLDIDITEDGRQLIKKKACSNKDLIYIFIKLNENAKDDFYLIKLKDLQEIIFQGYKSYLDSHNGKRPRNPKSTHAGISKEQLNLSKDNWNLLFGN